MKRSRNLIAGLAGLALLATPAWAQNLQNNRQPAGQNTRGQYSDNARENDNAIKVAPGLKAEAKQTIAAFKKKDPSLKKLFRNAAGFAVFPKVTEGALGVGAAHSVGLVYQKGKPVGQTTLTKVTVGAQAGGETFSEVIFFQTPQALQEFKTGNYEFSAATSAVAAAEGAGQTANYANGVAVFTLFRTGLMAKAAVGGQKFSYTPLIGNNLGRGGAASGTKGGGSQEQPQQPER